MSEMNPVLDVAAEETLDADVARYEYMDISLVKMELQEHGIDPASTVVAVTSLIESALAERQDPKKKR